MKKLNSLATRRQFCVQTSVLLASNLFFPPSVADSRASKLDMPLPDVRANLPKIKVAMLIHSKMALLDLVGPQTVLKILGTEIYLVNETLTPVSTDLGISITPNCTFKDCPGELDVLFVPGGLMGTLAAMEDMATIAFLKSHGATAKYVTSVCTGGLLLGAAGLLQGYRATAHWGVSDLLPLFGAIKDTHRVVHDRNRLTGGGVTAGIDFGLTLASLLRGEEAAKHVQLIMEYSPEPPFRAGTPDEVGATQMIEERRRRVWMDEQALNTAKRAAYRLGLSGYLPSEQAR